MPYTAEEKTEFASSLPLFVQVLRIQVNAFFSTKKHPAPHDSTVAWYSSHT